MFSSGLLLWQVPAGFVLVLTWLELSRIFLLYHSDADGSFESHHSFYPDSHMYFTLSCSKGPDHHLALNYWSCWSGVLKSS